MVPGREGERPCRRLALLQPEAQLPVTRVGEQGAPPRRVGRLLSGCGARPPDRALISQIRLLMLVALKIGRPCIISNKKSGAPGILNCKHREH